MRKVAFALVFVIGAFFAISANVLAADVTITSKIPSYWLNTNVNQIQDDWYITNSKIVKYLFFKITIFEGDATVIPGRPVLANNTTDNNKWTSSTLQWQTSTASTYFFTYQTATASYKYLDTHSVSTKFLEMFYRFTTLPTSGIVKMRIDSIYGTDTSDIPLTFSLPDTVKFDISNSSSTVVIANNKLDSTAFRLWPNAQLDTANTQVNLNFNATGKDTVKAFSLIMTVFGLADTVLKPTPLLFNGTSDTTKNMQATLLGKTGNSMTYLIDYSTAASFTSYWPGAITQKNIFRDYIKFLTGLPATGTIIINFDSLWIKNIRDSIIPVRPPTSMQINVGKGIIPDTVVITSLSPTANGSAMVVNFTVNAKNAIVGKLEKVSLKMSDSITVFNSLVMALDSNGNYNPNNFVGVNFIAHTTDGFNIYELSYTIGYKQPGIKPAGKAKLFMQLAFAQVKGYSGKFTVFMDNIIILDTVPAQVFGTKKLQFDVSFDNKPNTKQDVYLRFGQGYADTVKHEWHLPVEMKNYKQVNDMQFVVFTVDSINLIKTEYLRSGKIDTSRIFTTNATSLGGFVTYQIFTYLKPGELPILIDTNYRPVFLLKFKQAKGNGGKYPVSVNNIVDYDEKYVRLTTTESLLGSTEFAVLDTATPQKALLTISGLSTKKLYTVSTDGEIALSIDNTSKDSVCTWSCKLDVKNNPFNLNINNIISFDPNGAVIKTAVPKITKSIVGNSDYYDLAVNCTKQPIAPYSQAYLFALLPFSYANNGYPAFSVVVVNVNEINMYNRQLAVLNNTKSLVITILVYDKNVGVEEEINNSLFISPNPAIDYININYQNKDLATCDIYNMAGALIETVNLAGQKIVALNSTNWPAGVYFYEVKKAGKIVVTNKFIIKK